MLEAKNISYSIGKKVLLHPSNLGFDLNLFHVIMGANGAGKSTLLKLLAGELHPSEGQVLLNEKNLSTYTKRELAMKRAVLSQHYNISFPVSAKDIVLMGRYPFFNTRPGKKDLDICVQAMELMNVTEFSERDYNTLSGGEGQKVQMSRALAQIWEATDADKKILFLDEPVSHLDIKYQYQLLQIAKTLCRQHTTVIAILHDINLAMSFADRILFMKKGTIQYVIDDLKELTTGMIADVFGVNASIIHPVNHKPVVIF